METSHKQEFLNDTSDPQYSRMRRRLQLRGWRWVTDVQRLGMVHLLTLFFFSSFFSAGCGDAFSAIGHCCAETCGAIDWNCIGECLCSVLECVGNIL